MPLDTSRTWMGSAISKLLRCIQCIRGEYSLCVRGDITISANTLEPLSLIGLVYKRAAVIEKVTRLGADGSCSEAV